MFSCVNQKKIRFSFLVLGVFILILCSSSFMGSKQAGVSDRYIVVLQDWVTHPSERAKDLASRHGLSLGHVYHHALKGFSATVPGQRLKNLQDDPDVKSVTADEFVFLVSKEVRGPKDPATGKGGKGGGGTQPPQVLPTGVDRVNADLNSLASINGVDQRVNVDVAILDTGIDKGHADLNVAGGVNFAAGNPKSYSDGNGHGTHVAGTVAALDNASGVVGVAPGARLWAVRVLDNNGSGFLSDVIAGIDWVTAKADVIDVANMSLGWTESNPDLSPAHEAIRNSVAKGVVYVVAAGNDSKDASSFSPATYNEVITVSAVADSDGLGGGFGSATSYGADDTFATFSNFGADVDLAAPGVDILSTLPGGGYGTKSGTSMASPHVTGVAALYVTLFGKPFDAQGVEAVRQGLLFYAVPQSSPDGFTRDPDSFNEPLVSAAF